MSSSSTLTTQKLEESLDDVDINGLEPNFEYIFQDFYSVKHDTTSSEEISNLLKDSYELQRFAANAVAQWEAGVPRLRTERNRDNKTSVSELIRSSMHYGLPSMGSGESTTNKEFRLSLIYTAHSLTNRHEASLVPVVNRIIDGFRECQQVQFRTVMELYLELTGKGSLATRINNILQYLKRRWLQQLIVSRTACLTPEPHVESQYLMAVGKELGMVEYRGAVHDKLANGLRDKKEDLMTAYCSLVTIEEIVDTIIQAIHVPTNKLGRNMDHDAIALQAEVSNFLINENILTANGYDEDGNVTKNAVVGILSRMNILLQRDSVIAIPAGYKVAENTTNIELFKKLFQMADDWVEMDGYSGVSTDRISFHISLCDLSAQLTALVSKTRNSSSGLANSLNVIALMESRYRTTVLVKGPEPLRTFLEELLNIRLRSQGFQFPSTLWLNTDWIAILQQVLTDDLNRYCQQCPICLKAHDYCVPALLPCRTDECINYFTEKNMGQRVTSVLKAQPQVMELMISVTYWAAVTGAKAQTNTLTGATCATPSGSLPSAAMADLDFSPFPTRFLTRPKFDGVHGASHRQYCELLNCLNRLPSTEVLNCLLETDSLTEFFASDVYAQETGHILSWIMNSSRTQLEYVPQQMQDSTEKKLFETTTDSKAKYMFRVMNPPEKMLAFEQAKTRGKRWWSGSNDTEYLFHGSAKGKWHSIVRHSLVVCSGTARQVNGAVYGKGIYLSSDFKFAHGYCRATAKAEDSWPQNAMGIDWCVLVVESLRLPSSGVHGNIKVAATEDSVIGRYLLCG
jgi:hypothetical protein